MAQLKHIFKGESLTMLFTFPESYDMARLQKHEVYINDTAFTGVIIGKTIELKLTSEQTDAMYGNQRISVWLDDTQLGVRKPYVGDIIVSNSNATPDNESTSSISDIIIPIVISATAITVGDIMYNYLIGRSAYEVWLDAGNTGTVEDFLADIKGDPFTYEDFTPEQLEALKVKGDPFTFDDFTPEQIQVLQAPAREAAEELPQLIEEEVTRVIAETPAKTNPGVIDLQPGEYLMDKIIAINALPEEEKPTAENPITINFYNHSKTIDWSRWNGLIHVPRFVHINFVGEIDWWPNDYYLGKGFFEGLLENNLTDKLFLGLSFSRVNDNGRVFVSGLPLNLNKIFFGGLDQSYQIASSYQDLIDNPDDFGEFEFNLVRVNGSKEDDIRNDALYKKVNGLFVDITPDFRNCEFVGVQLIGAYLYSANLEYANLWNANLGNANLWNANLENIQVNSFSNFRGAVLTGAYNLPENLNTKAKFIAAVVVNNVNDQTLWIDGTSILS